MLTPPELLWRTEPGSLYTILLVNTDIGILSRYTILLVNTDIIEDSLKVHNSPG